MNKKRHGTFLVLERELFSLKKFKKKFKKNHGTPRHRGTCRCAVNLRHDARAARHPWGRQTDRQTYREMIDEAHTARTDRKRGFSRTSRSQRGESLSRATSDKLRTLLSDPIDFSEGPKSAAYNMHPASE